MGQQVKQQENEGRFQDDFYWNANYIQWFLSSLRFLAYVKLDGGNDNTILGVREDPSQKKKKTSDSIT